MFRLIIKFIRLKLSCGFLFEIMVFLRWPWWGGKPDEDKEMIINPTYNLRLVGDMTDSRGFHALRGVTVASTLTAFDHRMFFDLLLSAAKCKGNPRKEKAFLALVPPFIIEMMEYTDILIDREIAPKAVKYMGRLEMPPASISVERAVGAFEKPAGRADYVVGKHFYLQRDNTIPVEIVELMGNVMNNKNFDFCNVFDMEPSILWCVDPCTDFISPFHLSDAQADIVSGLLQGTFPLNDISNELFEMLKEVEVLVTDAGFKARRAAHEKCMADNKAFLVANEYVVVKSSFNLLHAAWQRHYLKALVTGGYFMPSDVQVPNRQFIHNEPYCNFLHHMQVRELNKLLPEVVSPSFSFLANYYAGSDLEKHIDREQCEWNVSMPMDIFPNVDVENAWPIYVQTDIDDDNSIVELNMGIGDVAVYRGTKLYHWRERMGHGRYANICFFHYVNGEFKGSLA